MTWDELSRDSLTCAQRLFEREEPAVWRSAVSRAYYAAYCAAAWKVCSPGKTFGRGWNNPPHEDVPSLLSGVAGLDASIKRRARRAIRILREARTDADYRPGRTIMREDAHRALSEAMAVMHNLGVVK